MKEFIEFIKTQELILPGDLVLAAVSGGKDSMCLLELLRKYACELGCTVAAAHFNHRLRGEESDRDARFVANYCLDIGIPCTVAGGDVSAFSRTSGMGTEEAARVLRYEFLEKTTDEIGAGRIATAHTADDNAETVLLNLTRGAGLRGLCGIPAIRGRIIRPLLTVTGRQVECYLSEHKIPHVEDRTNAEDVYNRNKLRHSVIPVLEDINPALCGTVTSMTELLRQDEECLEAMAGAFIQNNAADGRVPIKLLAELPRAVSSRVIRALGGSGLTAEHVAQVLALCGNPCPSARCSLPGMTVRREYEMLVFGSVETGGFEPFFLNEGEMVEITPCSLRVSCKNELFSRNINKSFTTFLFNSNRICGKIFVRPRRMGDKVNLAGRGGTKSLHKLFIEGHIPAGKRQLIPVICDDSGILAVYGFGVDSKVSPKPGDAVLNISFEEII